MISSYNITSQAALANGVLTFTTDRILTGCTATRDGSTFHLNKPGYYYITFNADAATTSAAGNVIVQLQSGGALVPGASASATSAAAGDLENLAFSTIIRVSPSCCAIDNTVSLTVVNAGVEATYTNVNINITKLC